MSSKDIVILPAKLQSLGHIKNHEGTSAIVRHLCLSSELYDESPAHVAVHYFKGSPEGVRGEFLYTDLHAHSCWEIAILIPGDRRFLFQVETPQGISYIRGRKTILIPPGIEHRMEFVRGRGTLICVVNHGEYDDSLI